VVDGQENQERLVAYVTAAGGADPAPGELRRHLSACLPAHMLPAAYLALPEMPLTLAGKIDRQSLPKCEPELLSSGAEFQAPSTPTEKRLAALWQQALEIPVAESTGNFFELGGDSLKAARLIVLIQHEFGKELPFATLLRAPTIANIAAVLDGDESTVGGTAFEFETVLSLQPHGSLPPLFCIASTVQGPYCFRPLSKHLGDDQPFWVANNIPKQEERLPTVEELAARACQSIRRIRPHGPYILGGYCFGGTVAFETAHQLRAMGEEVRLIALFDTPAPGYPKLLRNHSRNWRWLREVLGAGNGASRIGVRDIISHLDMAGQMIKRKMVAKTERQLARLELTPLVPTAGNVARWQERSTAMYIPKPIDVPIAQFIAQDEVISTRILDDPRLAWREMSRSEFHMHRVRGSHGTLLGNPQVLELAPILRELLRQVNSEVERRQPPAVDFLNGTKRSADSLRE
jgi:thioesterase domain-containing protein/acyl carrier protein